MLVHVIPSRGFSYDVRREVFPKPASSNVRSFARSRRWMRYFRHSLDCTVSEEFVASSLALSKAGSRLRRAAALVRRYGMPFRNYFRSMPMRLTRMDLLAGKDLFPHWAARIEFKVRGMTDEIARLKVNIFDGKRAVDRLEAALRKCHTDSSLMSQWKTIAGALTEAKQRYNKARGRLAVVETELELFRARSKPFDAGKFISEVLDAIERYYEALDEWEEMCAEFVPMSMSPAI